MTTGIVAVVQDGFVTFDFLDKSKRGPAIDALLKAGATVEPISRSGPRKQYRVPLGNAIAAGLMEGAALQDGVLDRADTGNAARLVAAEAEKNEGGADAAWHQMVNGVKGNAYVGQVPNDEVLDRTTPATTLSEGSGAPDKPNGIATPTAWLQGAVHANTPNPADYAPTPGNPFADHGSTIGDPAPIDPKDLIPGGVGMAVHHVGLTKPEAATENLDPATEDVADQDVQFVAGDGEVTTKVESATYDDGVPDKDWKRDALEAYAVNKLGFEDASQAAYSNREKLLAAINEELAKRADQS